jgi:NADH:ubiquinone oxidoreductase subunit C
MALFEAVHGSAPKYTGLNKVNPTAMILSGVLMLRYLKEEEHCNILMCLSGAESPEFLESVYHLFSESSRRRLTIKVKLPKDKPEVATIGDLWPGAYYFEREAYDLFGIVYKNHPDLRRIMLPEDWVGHPLRKNYVDPTQYGGINNERIYPCDVPKVTEKK